MNTRNQSARQAFVECLLKPGHSVLWTAASAPAARDAFELMRQFAARREFAPFVTKVLRSQGQERIEFKNGSRIVFICRNGSAGRGISGVNLLVYDGADRPSRARIRDLVRGDAGRLEADELAPTQFGVDNPETWRIPSAWGDE